MTKKTNTKWFIHCLDSASNEFVAEATSGLYGTDKFRLTICADGVKRYLYEVPDFQFANRLFLSQKQLQAKLQIFTSQNDGKPKAWETVVRNKTPKISLAEIRRGSAVIVRSALQHRQR